MTTNYRNTFIAVSPDTAAQRGEEPRDPDSIAGITYALLRAHPYALTSDDLLFEIHARRRGVPDGDRARGRAAFFARPQACLRASPLV